MPKLELAEPVLERIRVESNGRARRIVTNLNNVAEWARNHAQTQIGADYDGAMYTGRPPVARTGGIFGRAA